jgi:hypothetical protein
MAAGVLVLVVTFSLDKKGASGTGGDRGDQRDD